MDTMSHCISTDENLEEEEFDLGCTLEQPAFALLAGRYVENRKEDEDVESSPPKNSTRVSFPIERLPVILGRTHPSEDPQFIGLGYCKALSRNHASISYRDEFGGQFLTKMKSQGGIKSSHDSDDVEYSVPSPNGKTMGDTILLPLEQPDNEVSTKNQKTLSKSLPTTGFYAIECLGRNKIFVGRQRVEQGQVALLEHGTTIKMASYSLYFLLPERENGDQPKEYIVPVSKGKRGSQKKQVRNDDEEEIGNGEDIYNNHEEEGSNDVDDENDTGLDDASTERNRAKNSSDAISRSTVDLLDRKTTSELFNAINMYITRNVFDRKVQLYSSAIMLHAVKDASMDPGIRALCRKEGGIQRERLSKWIESSPVYERWSSFIISHMRPKSYEANLTRALIRVGYGRTGTSGRYFKWVLPKDVKEKTGLEKSSEKKRKRQIDDDVDEDTEGVNPSGDGNSEVDDIDGDESEGNNSGDDEENINNEENMDDEENIEDESEREEDVERNSE